MHHSLVISIVSHQHRDLVKKLLYDLSKISFSSFSSVEVILTLNVPEDESDLTIANLPLTLVRNKSPLGFGHNHNNAFEMFDSDYFLILNPDVSIHQDIDIAGVSSFSTNWGCFGPLVYSIEGELEDSARKFPTLKILLHRRLSREKKLDYQFVNFKTQPMIVDWIGGMFMLFKSNVYRQLNGFDKSYFMYLEDVDICRRTKKLGFEVIYYPGLQVIHDARKASFKSFRHFRWHLKSLLTYWFKNLRPISLLKNKSVD